MLKNQLLNFIKRSCHNHSRSILYLPKPTNPLVECESNNNINSNTPCVKETKIYINDNNLIHNQHQLLPVKIHYFDKNTICKITVEIIN